MRLDKEDKVGISSIYNWIDVHKQSIQSVAIPLIAILMLSVYFMVMATGGIKYVFSHSMYLPIVLASVIFGALGGIVAAILGGLILGPYVPIDTLTGEAQLTINWIFRMGFFALIGLIVGLASDGIRAYIKHLRWAARHDSATYLPNRFALETDLKSVQSRSHRKSQERQYCLIMISVANSKEIETHFGMTALDHIVMQISSRIKKHTPADTTVYRTSIDQLCLMIVESKHLDIKTFCRQLRKFFQEPFLFNTLQLHGDIQIGVVKFDEMLQAPSYYIQKACAATVHAEISNAPNVVILNHESDYAISENIELLGHLKDALDGAQLQLHYQPKIDLGTGEILHAEALMRWRHPSLGDIPPGKFIPRAERSTLIDRLTEFAIDDALSQVVKWEKAGFAMKVAVNISAQNLTQPSFVYQVMTLLEKHGVSGTSLELELTENSLMHNVANAIDVLTKLTRLGIVISIDDFGTGYSSLQYLQRLPVSVIKIDQSFVLNLAVDDGCKHIVDAAANLAHKIDMQVVAEGVEDQHSLKILQDSGCDYAQGYFIARPMTAHDFAKWRTQAEGFYSFSKSA